jgi:hypothetical protein
MTTLDTRTELARKQPAQIVRTDNKTIDALRGEDGRFRAKRGGPSGRGVGLAVLVLVFLFLFGGFVLSLIQQA